MLDQKSIHELRGIAQSFGIGDLFTKDKAALVQLIRAKQAELVPVPEQPIPRPEYRADLMQRPPSKSSTEAAIRDLLAPHVERGLHLTFPEPERWEMRYGKRMDSGTTRMPLRVVLNCAEKVMA